MSGPGIHSVRTIRDTALKSGETRILRRTLEIAGDEPDFYAVHTKGDYLYIIPRWTNPPHLELRPRPRIGERAGVALSSVEKFQFEVDGSAAALADLYYCSVGLWLVSDRLLDVVQRKQPGGVEHSRVSMYSTTGDEISGFNIAMPTIVLDAVDTSKTDVTISRVTGGPDGYITVVRFDSGYVLKGSTTFDLMTFREEFAGDWLWYRDVFIAAKAAGVRGITGRFTTPGLREEIII